jgi:hypothetical protein
MSDFNSDIGDMLSGTRGLGGRKITRTERLAEKKARKFQRRDLRLQGYSEEEIREMTLLPAKDLPSGEFNGSIFYQCTLVNSCTFFILHYICTRSECFLFYFDFSNQSIRFQQVSRAIHGTTTRFARAIRCVS